MAALFSSPSAAFDVQKELGHAVPWQLGFQEGVTPMMHKVVAFHDSLLLPIIYATSALVMVLLVYVMLRFNAKANPKPSKNAHNTVLEIVWTALPVIILLVIAIPSFRLLYYVNQEPEAEMTLKVVGYQWYWGYEYPDNNNIAFESRIKADNELEEGDLRLLAVDKRVVVPVDTTIRVLVTASDVIHSWAVPAFGIKTDAVPGRVNQTWMKIDRPGTYYGQCSELCGVGHGYMPIVVEAVTKEEFEAWTKTQQASIEKQNAPLSYASNQ
ncbi:MAG: coxB [Rickettsiales bacterium]|nr:coxB [Rickettsiales bacterium]